MSSFRSTLAVFAAVVVGLGATAVYAQSDDFRRVLVAMDMCSEEPRVVIGNLSGRGDMAYLQELRAKNVSEA